MEDKIILTKQDYPELLCGLTKNWLKDSLMDPEGHCYERGEIMKYLTDTPSSPFTGRPLLEHQLRPCRILTELMTHVKTLEDDSTLFIMKQDIIKSFVCPITLQAIYTPVISISGHCYSRSELEQWLQKKNIDPVSRQICGPRDLWTATIVSSLLDKWQYFLYPPHPWYKKQIFNKRLSDVALITGGITFLGGVAYELSKDDSNINAIREYSVSLLNTISYLQT